MGKYHYTRLSIGITNYPDIFQQNMNSLFHVFEFIRVYIDELLILTKRYLKDHVQKLEITLNKLKENGPKYMIEKYFFGHTEM